MSYPLPLPEGVYQSRRSKGECRNKEPPRINAPLRLAIDRPRRSNVEMRQSHVPDNQRSRGQNHCCRKASWDGQKTPSKRHQTRNEASQPKGRHNSEQNLKGHTIGSNDRNIATAAKGRGD